MRYKERTFLGARQRAQEVVEQVAHPNAHEPPDIPVEERAQLDRVMRVLRHALGETLVGAYLFGSAVGGGLKPRSDLDVMVVVSARMTTGQKSRLISQLLRISGDPRHLEVTVVVETDVRPWRYPPRMELQYGDWWRAEFERGELQPWSEINPDLATLIKMVLVADTSLHGPPPGEMFDAVPRQDLVAATLDGIDALLDDLDGDARNVVLTLARMWSGLATEKIMSKDAAAEWALVRLPETHQRVLAEARAIYVGEAQAESNDFVPRARRYAQHVVAQIQEYSLSDDS